MKSHVRSARVAGVSLLVAALLLAPASPGRAADEARRARRGLKALEQVVNEMLVESRNVIVSSSEAARAHRLPEYGVVLAFEASLLQNVADWRMLDGWRGSRIRREDGTLIVNLNDDDDEKGDSTGGKSPEKGRATVKDREARDAARYAGFKKEMADALVDAADYTGALRDETWLALSAALGDDEYFRDQGIRQYVVRARVADLAAYADGRLTESALRDRIVTEEF